MKGRGVVGVSLIAALNSEKKTDFADLRHRLRFKAPQLGNRTQGSEDWGIRCWSYRLVSCFKRPSKHYLEDSENPANQSRTSYYSSYYVRW
jgi:hypothetical protein